MIFFQFTVKTKEELSRIYEKGDEEKNKDVSKYVCDVLNGMEKRRTFDETPYLLMTSYENRILTGVCVMPSIVAIQGVEQKLIGDRLFDFYHVSIYSIECWECTEEQVMEDIGAGLHPRDGKSFGRKFRMNYLWSSSFTLNQRVLPASKYNREQALERADEILAGQSLKEEIYRIYEEKNICKFFGHPAHYKVVASSRENAYEMIDLLVNCLFGRGRLLGTRIEEISDIHPSFHNDDRVRNLFSNAAGETVVMELIGDEEETSVYASDYNMTVAAIQDLVQTYANKTLCIFVEITETPALSRYVLENVTDYINIIEVREGAGDEKKARAYLNKLIQESELSWCHELTDKAFSFDKKEYYPGEIREMFSKEYIRCMTKYVYPAYQKCEFTMIEKEEKTSNSYEELMHMVGLEEIKKLVDQMIAFYRMQKVKAQFRLGKENCSMHMLFTGNPGSAKTSVARLLADIFMENEILESGKMIECGRSDLVGKYVGWTAKIVKKKFQQARGGILFIDEAYALVDGSNTYGDEAINTIVQEMENQRGDVLVIFAGYPEKMKKFLDANEGLRSRIAFHLDFPDYDADELLAIMQKLASDRGYHISVRALEYLHMKFDSVCRRPEYGNGRYARNVLEQAIIKQSQRLSQNAKKNWAENELFSLREVDFETSDNQVKKEIRQIGFVAC